LKLQKESITPSKQLMKYHIRVGSTNRIATKEELSRLFQQSYFVHYDLSPVEGSGLSDFDETLLHEYWQNYYQINYLELEEAEKSRILLNAGLLTELDGRFACSVSGLLMFGRYPQQRILNAGIVLTVFNGDDPADPLLVKKKYYRNFA